MRPYSSFLFVLALICLSATELSAHSHAPQYRLVTLSSGTFTINTVNLATAATTYVLPDSCGSATGNWVTIVAQDAELIIINPADDSDTMTVDGTTATNAGDVLDSPGTIGASITLTCLATDKWYATAMTGQWVDGGTS